MNIFKRAEEFALVAHVANELQPEGLALHVDEDEFGCGLHCARLRRRLWGDDRKLPALHIVADLRRSEHLVDPPLTACLC